MRYLAVLLILLPLSSCGGFIFIPGPGMVQALDDKITGPGQYCAPENVKVGDRLKHQDGWTGRVTHVGGESGRCQNPKLPIRVDVSAEYTPPPQPESGDFVWEKPDGSARQVQTDFRQCQLAGDLAFCMRMRGYTARPARAPQDVRVYEAK